MSLCDENDIKIALGLSENDVQNPLVCGYLQMYQGDASIKVPVVLNSHFLLGPAGAHINVSGISGLAAKTSFSMFLLKAIQEKFRTENGETVAFVFFNVKGRDLMAIDEPNTELSSKDKNIYQIEIQVCKILTVRSPVVYHKERDKYYQVLYKRDKRS